MKNINRVASEKTIYFELPGSSDLKIKGIVCGELTDPLAVMMHGRPGNGNELLQHLAARYLSQQGIATLRLWMYDFGLDTRSIMDCTLQTHVNDFAVVVNELRRQGVNKLFAIGHSYGGLTILKSHCQLDGAVLWDPSHGLAWAKDREMDVTDIYPEVIIDKYVIGIGGEGWVYPLAAFQSDRHLGDTSTLADKKYPLKIISAGKGILRDLGERYYQAANQPKSHVVIEEAHHRFEDSDEVMLELYKETADWLTRL